MLKDVKDAKNEKKYFLHSELSLLQQIKTDGNDTLLLSIPNTSVFKDSLPPAMHCWFTMFCTCRPDESMKQNILSFHM